MGLSITNLWSDVPRSLTRVRLSKRLVNQSPRLELWAKLIEKLYMSLKPPKYEEYCQYIATLPYYRERAKPKGDMETRHWDVSKCYIYLHEDPIRLHNFDRSGKNRAAMLKKSRVLAFWCFDPGLGFAKLRELNPRSIILTSGTLTPMDSTASELKNPFPVRIECPHVIGTDQVLI